MEARFRNNKLITTKDFEREIELLKESGKMLTLDQVLRAMAEAREDIGQKIQEQDWSVSPPKDNDG